MTSKLHDPETGPAWVPKPPSGVQAEGTMTYGRERIFVKRVKGYFQRMRWLTFAFFLTVFTLLPLLTWGDRRAILFDIPARKFYLFNIIVWPQEFYLVTALLLMGAMGIFFLTTLVGRLWCGYLCPQTVVTNLFMTVERWVEGDRLQQQKLSAAPWSAAKTGKFVLKNALWAVMAAAFGFTFVSYFVPQSELISALMHPSLSATMIAFLMVSGFTLFDGGYFREQMCLVPCPYGRFQGVMIDDNSLMVAYDAQRGEPRGFKGTTTADCVDCTLCVQVCPTGIDIRNGLQYECIGCAACVDVCNSVMTKLDRPTGLIRYTSLSALKGLPFQAVRGRTVLYGGITLLATGFVAYSLYTRPDVALDVIRGRQALAYTLPDGRISNMYTIKLLNKDDEGHSYTLSLQGIPGTIEPPPAPVFVSSGEVASRTVSVIVPPGLSVGSHPFTFTVVTADEPHARPVITPSTLFVPLAQTR
ncbi:MAG: cytochrome c oxidase accessory protein CcoG [Candidatus Sericytochromatia bacterium]|nr:cytochrome c oxidase accessory protein CcoG [Candidatus Sericytochromatia bacterium]